MGEKGQVEPKGWLSGLVVIPAKAGIQLQTCSGAMCLAHEFNNIRTLLKANADMLDMDEVRRYFAFFDREDLLEALKDGG